jgi:hypothetical protein
MKKTWLYSAVAGIALLATACANNAAPHYNRPNGTNVQNFAGGPGGMFDGTTRATNFYPNGYTTGTMHNYNAFNGTGMRGAGGYNGISLYRDGGMTTAGAGQNGAGLNGMNQMGYVRVDRNYLRTNSATTNRFFVDRNALAHIVGNVTASCPGVNASTVLVTDEECFVGLNLDGNNGLGGGQAGGRTGGETNYQPNGGTMGNQTMAQSVKAQARMNAMSVCPRYYKVYVTDNQQMIDELTRIASRYNNAFGNGQYGNALNDERTIDSLVRRMGGLPDGEDMAGRGSTMTTEMHRTHKAGTKGTTSR